MADPEQSAGPAGPALRWYRRDREAVLVALRRGERPEMATTSACGPLDELVALHQELGIFAALDDLEVQRVRAGVPDALLWRTLGTLPFVAEAALSGAVGALFREPALLLQLGWAPAHLRAGTNGRHRHPDGRQAASLPCHPDTLRDALRRVSTAAWERAQQAGVRGLFDQHLVRGHVYAIDGTGLSDAYRLVVLVCVSTERPLLIAWRLLEGAASEKGREAHVTRALVEQALALGGPGCVRLLLADALYADGPLLAWLKDQHGIDALVRLPADRCLYQDLQGLAQRGLVPWTRHRFTHTVQGHKVLRTIDTASVGEFTSWDSFSAAAATSGAPDATLWACLVREIAPTEQPLEDALALVSTRPWADGGAAVQAYRARWHIEDDANRELKEGWGLEAHRWGRDAAAVQAQVTLTSFAFNTTQVYRSRAGEHLAGLAIRRLRRQYQPALGAAPAVIYLADCYAVLALEDLLAVLGAPVRQSLLPTGRAGATAHVLGPAP